MAKIPTSRVAFEAERDAWKCEHEKTDVRGFSAAHGTIYAKQCMICGERVGNWIKKDEAFRLVGQEPAPQDETLADMFVANVDAVRDAAQAEWWKNYNAYLETAEWKKRRDLVIRRDGNVCRGCLTNRATQVHHLTYEHVGAELLWELVAICDECHALAHPKDAHD